jgi:predicted phage tail protein
MFRYLRALFVVATLIVTSALVQPPRPSSAASAPGVPTALAVSSLTANTLTLSWSAPFSDGGAVISGYDVFRGGVKLTRTTGRSYQVSGLAGGTTYALTVRACNAVGCSTDSEPVGLLTKPAGPTITRTTASPGAIAVEWSDSPSSGVSDYGVWFRVNSSTNWVEWTSGVSDVSGTTLTGLTNGATYAVKVRASSPYGFTDSVSVLATPMAVPTAPTLTFSSITSSSIVLNWTALSAGGAAPQSYDLFKDGVKVINTTAKYRTVPNLIPLQQYSFTVSACNVAGCSPQSSPLLATIPPPAPTKLGGSAQARRAALTWTPSPYAISHTVWFKLAAATTWTEWTPGSSDTSPATVTGLEGGAVYNFKVTADGPAGTSASTAILTLIPFGGPSLPKAPRQTSATNSSIGVTWVAPANGGSPLTGFKVLIGSTVVASVGPNVLTATINNLAKGSRQVVSVQACNIVECSASSPTVNAFTIPEAATALGIDKSATTATVTWTASSSSEVTGYKIFFKPSSRATWTEHTPSFDDTSGTTITGLVALASYDLYVRAYNAAGVADTATATFSTLNFLAPAAPTGITALPALSGARVSWIAQSDNGSPISDYDIEYSQDSGTTWVVYADGVSTATSVVVPGLSTASTYVFRVKARNVAGASAASAVSAAVTPFTLAGTPTAVTATSTSTQATISWNAPASNGGAAITDYVIQHSTNGTTWTTFSDGVSPATQATVMGLTNGITYTFRVAAVNDAGTGAFSNASNAVMPLATPSAPTKVLGVAGTASVRVSWTVPAVSGGATITDYAVQYSSDAGGSWLTFTDGTSVTTAATVTGLANGTSYLFRVAAISSAGTGSYSLASSAVSPRTTPDAPTAVTGTPAAGAVTVSWLAPAWEGGNAVSDYLVQFSSNAGAVWRTFADSISTSTSARVTGLTNGTSYIFRVVAVNGAGAGTASEASAPVIPRTNPGIPTLIVPVAGDSQAVLTWRAPTANGGSALTNYLVQYSEDTGATWVTFDEGVSTDTTTTITGLTNGKTYVFRIAAENIAGAGAYSAMTASLILRTPSDPPTNVTSSGGRSSAIVSWDAPARDGGAAIYDYVIQYSTNSGATWFLFGDGTSTATSTTLGGLTNGLTYIFRVAAYNAAGVSSFSSPSSPVVPRSVPGAPTTLITSPGDSQIGLRWTTPATDGASPITDYIVEYSQNSGTTWSSFDDGISTDTSVTVTGLTNGTSYIFRVAAQNAIGTGNTSANSQPATPRVTPDPPTTLNGVSDDTQVLLTWVAPAFNGGAPLSDYVIQYSSDSGSSWTSFADGINVATQATVTGLTNGTSYVFRVASKNAAGTGEYSTNSDEVTPRRIADAPTEVVGSFGDSQVSLQWTIPPSDGGSAILDYVIQFSDDLGATWTTFDDGVAASPTATVVGLANGTSYVFRAAAVNVVGTSPYSSPSDPVVPRAVSSAPQYLSASEANSASTLSFQAPLSDGGTEVLDYTAEVSSDDGATWTTYTDGVSSALSITVSGLQNGTSYIFRVSASNNVGQSPYSDVSNTVTPHTIPDAPTALTASALDTAVALAWAAPSSAGGAEITDYLVQYSSDSGLTWNDFSHTPAAETSLTVDGLTNRTAYKFRVAAINRAGAGPFSTLLADATPVKSLLAPTELSATAEDSKLDLSWVAPVSDGPISDYQVQISSDEGLTWASFDHPVSSATSISVTSLTNGTTYVVRVAAVNQDGTGAFTDASSPVTPRTTPDAPSALAGTAGDTSVELTWEASAFNGGSAILDYVVQHSDDAGSTWVTFEDGITTSTSTTVTGLQNGTSYVFRVAAANVAGLGAHTAASGSITPVTGATAPLSLAGTYGDREVSLAWVEPSYTGGSAITDYIVEYSNDGGQTFAVFEDGIGAGTTSTVTDLQNGTGYVFKVAAFTAAGKGASSEISPVVTPRTTPDAPTAVVGAARNAAIALAWDAPSSNGGSTILDYLIQYSSDGGQSWSAFSAPTSNATSALVDGLTNGTSYEFRVAAINDAGSSSYSASSAAVIPHTVASKPLNLTGAWGDQSAQLNWDAPSSDGGAALVDYIIELSTDDGDTWELYADGVSDATTATVSGLQNGTLYKFRVAAVNIAGPGAFSDTSSGVVPHTVPGAPTTVAGTAGDQSVELTWDAPSSTGGAAISDYEVEYREVSDSAWTSLSASASSSTARTITGLSNGTTYEFRIAAVNHAGTGAFSATSDPVTPLTVTSTPTDVTGVFGDTEAAITWNAPADNGGTAVTDYVIEVSSNTGATWDVFEDGVSTQESAIVTGLQNGVGYVFRIKALNAVGASAPSLSSDVVVPRTLADAPTDAAGTFGNTEVALTWSAPSIDGGAAISDYVVQFSSDNTTWTTFSDGTSASTSTTVTGLTNGTSYTFRVAAINNVGTGDYSSASAAVIPRTLADAPTDVVATFGNAQATLSWSVPASNGGAAISDYEIQYSSDETNWTTFSHSPSASDASTVTGLTNGTSYTFRVAAVNNVGTGAFSASSNAVTPRTTATSPVGVVGVYGDTEVSLLWTAPASNGGAVITDYVIQYSDNGSTWEPFADGLSASTSATVTGLANGTSYTFRVAATNNVGTGSYSAASAAVIPRTLAGAPTAVAGTYGNTEVALTWSAPAVDGGAAVTDYAVQYSSDDTTWTTFADGTSASTSATVTGLTNGTSYTFRVAATNNVGTGAHSDASPAVTPRTLAGAPTAVTSVYGDTQVSLTWSAPVSDGGAAITDYAIHYSSDAGSTWTMFADGTSASTSATVTGLTNGTSYRFKVAATNNVGTGSFSTVSAPVTPRTLSDAPTDVAGTYGNTEVALTWSAPVIDGGAAVTDYAVQYSSDDTTWTTFADGTSASTSTTVTGLTNGTSYTFRVAATNNVGTGAYSSASAVVIPRTLADAPTDVSGTYGNTEVALTWSAPAINGGAAISDYVIQYSSDDTTWTTFADGTSASTSTTVMGLTNGTSYSFRVAAVNNVGTGAYSAASAAVIPRTLADAPTDVAGTYGNTEVALTWSAPAINGGAAISDYVIQYSSDDTTWTTFADGASASTSATVTGLTNGVTYSFRVAATNNVGTGDYSAASAAVTPRTLADAPTDVAATASPRQASLSWSAPVSDGGASVSDYVIQFSSDDTTWTTFADGTSSVTSATVTGLTNGVTYSFRVASVNNVGAGSYSSSSNSVMPLDISTPPTAVDGAYGNTEVALTWSSPSDIGGAVISDYVIQYSSNSGATWTTFADGVSSSTSATVTGLTNGTEYIFRVAATNVVGTSPYSAASTGVTPSTLPGAPTNLVGVSGVTEVALTWGAPESSGGAVISDYVIQYSSNSGTTWTTFADGVSSSISTTVTGLTNGTEYIFRVAAKNRVGQGAYSDSSTSVTPATLSDAPTAVTGTFADTATTLSWTAPSFNGGAEISDYAIQFSTNGTTWTTFADGASNAVSTTVTGLTNGTSYTFRVAAINRVGQGAYSTVSAPVTPRTLSDAPTDVAGTYGNTEVALTWAAPAVNGGATITDYVVQSSTDGSTWTAFADGTSSATSATVTGLTNGTSYTFRVAAINNVGTGSYSAASAAVTPRTLAEAPTAVVGTYGNTEVALTWSAPAIDGGAAVSDYIVQYSSNAGSTWSTFSDSTSSSTSATVTGLTNGTSYTFRVAATNNVGTGSYSTASAAVIPRTLAGAPTAVAGTYGNTEVALTWSAPAVNGGAAISDYAIQYSSDGTTWTTFADGTSASTSATVTGLTNGTSYTFRAAAVNNVGTGSYSAASAAVIPRTLAGAPTAVAGTYGNTEVALTWTTPAVNGGAAISDYAIQYSTNGTTWTTFADGASASTSATVTGLTNGTSYTFRVAATNNVGTGSYSTASAAVIPRTLAGAPTAVAGTYGNTEVALTWSAPAVNGGAAISDYAIQYSSDGTTWTTFADGTSASTSATVTGLTNGTSYTFRAAAVNNVGTGSYSAASAAVIPRTLAGAPTAVAGTYGNTEVALTWTTPASNGGASVTDYTIQYSSDGTTWTTFADGTSTSTLATVTGLTNGTSYTFRVAATNNVGTGAYSTASAAVVPRTFAGAPTNLTSTEGDTLVELSWTAPASNGGAAISDYTIQYSSDGTTWTTFADGTSASTSATVTGLTNGTSYTFRVAAVNNVGTGSYSASSAAVVPRTTPGVPTLVLAVAGNMEVSLNWTAPADNGGSSVYAYLIERSKDGGAWTFATATSDPSATIGALFNGSSYRFRVAAMNSAGTGSFSAASEEVTPATTPDAPSSVTGTAGNTNASLTWAAPAVNGGASISDYAIQYSSNSGSTWTTFADGTSASTSATVTGLTNGTSYTFRVAAINNVGTGDYSTASAVVTPVTTAGAPTAVAGTAGNAQATLTWATPTSTGGTAITDYIVQSSTDGTTWTTFADGTSTATIATVTGLTNGTAYTFRVAAVNSVGTGSYSTASPPVTPVTTSDAPTTVAGSSGNTQVSLTWTAPASSGGAAITDYQIQYSSNSGSTWATFADGTSSSTSAIVTGLTNGTSYIFRVAATNSVGTSAYSAASSAVTPATTPSAPTALTGFTANAQAPLMWAVPASDGGSAITDYVIQYSSDSGTTWTTFADGTSTSQSAIVTGLTNGTSYIFRVAAVNAVGTSSYSTASPAVTPRTTPDAPTAVTGIAGNAQASLTWTAPTSNGGAAITDYIVQSSTDGTNWTTFADGTSTTTSATVTGLTNGTSYTFRVAAANAAGNSSYSTASAAVTPVTTAGAPTAVAGTAGNTQVSLIWTPPTSTGGTAITDYIIQSSTNGTTWTTFADDTSTAASATVTGLTNGTSYTFRVAAVNAVGAGSYSTASSSVTPMTTAEAPTAVTGAAGAAQVALTWTAPTSNGGAAITDYVIQSSTDGSTWTTFADGTSAATSATVTGLSNGTAYTFRVAAVNAAGTSTYSTVSESVTPLTTAGAPTSLAGISGNTEVSLTWIAPASNGGTTITDYIVQSSTDGSTWTTFADGLSMATSTTVTGLSNGTSYTFRVAAVNAMGTGEYSTVSGSLTPATTPDAPTAVTGSIGSTQVTVSWTAPSSNGGASIYDYVIQYSSNSGTTWTTFADGTSASTSTTVTGLTNGTSYVFQVAATNAAGTGTYSAASSSVAPVATPGTPASLSGVAGNAQVALSWTAPTSDGGSALTDYIVQYSSNSGSTWTTFADGTTTSTNATVTGLTNGTSYTFRVAAMNVAGAGTYSSASSAVTPLTTPGTPTGATAVVGNAQINLSWTAPTSDGGSALTDYIVEYSSNSGSTWAAFADGTSTATSATVPGLTNGTSYTFRVAAVNGLGAGSYSTASNAVTAASTPGVPTGVSGTRGNTQVAVTWSAPASNGGSAISDYIVQYSSNSGSTWTTFSDGTSTTTSATVTGLANGTGYTFRVAAVNAIGTGTYSSASSAVTPATTPGAPSITQATGNTTSVTLTFSAPASNGGSAVTAYTASCASSNGGTASSSAGAGSPLTVSSLTAGKAYSCSVTATNAVGTGSASSAKSLAAAWVDTSAYSCPSGGSLSGSTCNVAASGWVNTNVAAYPTYSCSIGAYSQWFQDYPNYTTLGSVSYINSHVGMAYGSGACAPWASQDWWASSSCWTTTSGGYSGTCGTTKPGNPSKGVMYRYRRRVVDIRTLTEYHSGWGCAWDYTLSGSTCIYWLYPDGGYYSSPASSYNATWTSSGYWNGWTIT